MAKPRPCAIAVVAAAFAMLLTAALPARAQDDVARFFAGRTIAILMGTSPGGSYDLYGRVIAQHLARHIPGKPTIIVEHMPGAGGVAAGNYIYGPGPQDGSKILLSHALPLMERLEDPKAIRYQSRRLHWLGAYDEIAQVMAIWHTAGAATVDDLRTRDLVFGSMATNHLSYQWAMLLKETLGANFRVISGYTTGGNLNLAMERGEIAGWSVAWESIASGKQNWVAEKKIAIPLVFTLDRLPQLPEVPTLLELAKGPQREIVEFLANGTPLARAMAVAPGVPAERVSALRAAFDAMMRDKEFLEDAAKRKLAIRHRTHTDVHVLLDKLILASPDLVQRVRNAIGQKG